MISHTNSIHRPDKEVVQKDFRQERPLWKHSSYGHAKEARCLLQGADWSQEEARLAYEEEKRATGSIMRYVSCCLIEMNSNLDSAVQSTNANH